MISGCFVFVAWCQEVQNIVQCVCVRFDMQCRGTSLNCWSCVWQVMDCVADTLENVDRGVRWIIEMSQRKWCVTSVGWRKTIHMWCASPLWADGKLFTSVGWQSVDGVRDPSKQQQHQPFFLDCTWLTMNMFQSNWCCYQLLPANCLPALDGKQLAVGRRQ